MIGNDFKAAVARRGAAFRQLTMFRNEDFDQTIVFKDVDFSADTFAAMIRHLPDSGGAPLATIDIDGPTFALGDTTIGLSLGLISGVVGNLPAAPETGQNAIFYWDLQRTSGGKTRTLFAGPVVVIPGSTQA
ncbi:MAG: hypothetical protein KYX66_18870 [Blastomonas fulva]|uniref:hypothetical protein n=1 Tax=Blastomonas fulva TaxID=1550728 RepID=UPI0024E25088|nr:hypothetical protein [Blastomonas fulva]MDK2758792.1 hypothetical protein [Blastomonas fulva]